MKDWVTPEFITEYRKMVFDELRRRGFADAEAQKVVATTGFEQALTEYPEVQLLVDPRDAVNEILVIALKKLL